MVCRQTQGKEPLLYTSPRFVLTRSTSSRRQTQPKGPVIPPRPQSRPITQVPVQFDLNLSTSVGVTQCTPSRGLQHGSPPNGLPLKMRTYVLQALYCRDLIVTRSIALPGSEYIYNILYLKNSSK